MYSHAWRRSSQQMDLWKQGEQTDKQPVAVSDVAYGIVNAMLDHSTAGKIYQAVGYVNLDNLNNININNNCNII